MPSGRARRCGVTLVATRSGLGARSLVATGAREPSLHARAFALARYAAPATRALPPLLSIRISPLHTYDEINLIKTLILFVLKTIQVAISSC